MTQIEIQWGLKIPLRDGVLLSANVYLPASARVPLPCIVTMTPYVADSFHEQGVFFASNGLPFFVVDVRGRGNSEGRFRPLIQEATDGFDVIEWIASQQYCNGQVVMWGGSYAGYAQWAAAKELPPHLAAIAPVAAPFTGVDFPMRNNIFYPYLMQWITFTSGRALQPQIFSDNEYWSSHYLAWHRSGKAFCELDRFFGVNSEVFQEWIAHPTPDDFWDAHNPTSEDFARIQIPVLTITGSYDDDQPGALEYYRLHLAESVPDERSAHHLVIGPWDHAGTRSPKREFGGLTFGPESLIDLNRLHVDWYGWVLQQKPKPAFLQAPVAYYVMGRDRWRYAHSLGSVTALVREYFLSSNGVASGIYQSGILSPNMGKGLPDSYTYDPRDAQARELEAEARVSGGSLVDQSVALALSGRQLVYHSEPFESDTEVSGFFKFSAWIAIDCPDTDFYVSVHEIDECGNSIRLSTDALRSRYREGLRLPRLTTTNQPCRYDFERFTFVSRQIRRGSRLRLIIAPIGRVIEGTFVQKNYNAGGDVATETSSMARPVTVRLFHDSEHPSILQVPIGRPEVAGEDTLACNPARPKYK